MNQLSLQEIKQTEFELLTVFDSFCRGHDISYFLSNGTLLGAVKYKGFIPWDDDIDVLVPREDYQRLLSLFRDDERYALFAFERYPDYRFPFAKLCDMQTRKQEQNVNNGVELGLDIDIFPLDAWDSRPKKAQREVRRINRQMRFLGWSKLRKPDSPNPLKRAAKGLVMMGCRMIGSRAFIRRIIRLSAPRRREPAALLGCKSWCIYGCREIIPAETFAGRVEVEFEGRLFPAPAGYDTYLRSLYGAYQEDPPLDKQMTHHRYSAYRL